MSDLKAMFEKHESEHCEFERIENPPSKRSDLCAFLFLDELVPGADDMVCAAEHDQVWLGVDVDRFAAVATEDDVIYLRRCGVFYDDGVESLSMFT